MVTDVGGGKTLCGTGRILKPCATQPIRYRLVWSEGEGREGYLQGGSQGPRSGFAGRGVKSEGENHVLTLLS